MSQRGGSSGPVGIFAFEYRYTGAAPTNNRRRLMATYGGGAIGLLMAGFSALSLAGVLLLRRHR